MCQLPTTPCRAKQLIICSSPPWPKSQQESVLPARKAGHFRIIHGNYLRESYNGGPKFKPSRTDYSIFDGKVSISRTPTRKKTSHLTEGNQHQSEAPSLQRLKRPRRHICRCDILDGDPRPQHTPSDLPVKSAAAEYPGKLTP